MDYLELSMTNKYDITAVPATLVKSLWPKLLPHLEKVVGKIPDEASLDSMLIKAQLGESLIVVVTESESGNMVAAIVLEIKLFDSGLRTLFVSAIGGCKFFEWEDQLFESVLNFAKIHNCQQIRAVAARSGWFKVAKNRPWEEVYTTFKYKVEV